ncbi:MAG: hypothetical protein WD802_09075 [Gemmatimonadaceae bacterium]
MSRRDSHQVPPELYKDLTAPENTSKAVEAMKVFLLRGDEAAFEDCVAIYVASARHRQEEIETVFGALCQVAVELEGPRREGLVSHTPTRMHQLIFSGILRAFYGDVVVDRELGASTQRKADAPQHTTAGTWPKQSS